MKTTEVIQEAGMKIGQRALPNELAPQAMQATSTMRKAAGVASSDLKPALQEAKKRPLVGLQPLTDTSGRANSLFRTCLNIKDSIFKVAGKPLKNSATALQANLDRSYANISNDLQRAQESSKDYKRFNGSITNQLKPLRAVQENPSWENLRQGYDNAHTEVQTAVDAGVLTSNKLAFDPLPANQPAAPVAATLVSKTITVLQRQIGSVEKMIRDYLSEVEKRNRAMERLEELKGLLRVAGEKIERGKNPELDELLTYAEKLGIKLPEGKVWSEKEKALLLENVDGRMQGLMNTNETDNFKLTMAQNTLKTVYELMSDLIKGFFNILERLISNLPKH